MLVDVESDAPNTCLNLPKIIKKDNCSEAQSCHSAPRPARSPAELGQALGRHGPSKPRTTRLPTFGLVLKNHSSFLKVGKLQ